MRNECTWMYWPFCVVHYMYNYHTEESLSCWHPCAWQPTYIASSASSACTSIYLKWINVQVDHICGPPRGWIQCHISLIIKSHKVSEVRDMVLKCSCRFEILHAPIKQRHRCVCRNPEQLENAYHLSRAFETWRGLTIRSRLRYWIGPLDSSSAVSGFQWMAQMTALVPHVQISSGPTYLRQK